MHPLYQRINECVGRIEEIYKISSSATNIDSFIEVLLGDLGKYSEKQKSVLANNSYPFFCMLSAALIRLEFFNLNLLEFNKVVLEKASVDCFRVYSRQSTLNAISRDSATNVVMELEKFESRDPFFAQNLEYRILRLFIVVAVYKNYISASILARIVLNQLSVA